MFNEQETRDNIARWVDLATNTNPTEAFLLLKYGMSIVLTHKEYGRWTDKTNTIKDKISSLHFYIGLKEDKNQLEPLVFYLIDNVADAKQHYNKHTVVKVEYQYR